MRVITAFLCCAALMLCGMPSHSADENALIDTLADELGNRKTVEQAIDAIAASGTERRGQWLELILSGKLYIRKSDGKVVSAVKSDAGFTLTSASDGSGLGEVGKRDVSKIKINNKLRGKLRTCLLYTSPSPRDA